MRYGMAIDLGQCIGCYACVIACKAEHGTPPGVFWAKVMEKEVGRYPAASRTFLPVLCNHCAEPLCEEVCPSGATYKRKDGLVLINQEACIGCRACMEACPYGARTFWNGEGTYYPEGATPFELRGNGFISGTVQKCTFCVERLDRGLEPACVETCPTSCRVFGDLDDPRSAISRLIQGQQAFQLRPESGTDPSVSYLR